MKGWSFNGLVKALKTAAFKDVGDAVGQVPLVGDNGLLSEPKNIDAADLNNIDYRSGSTLRINPPYAEWPFEPYLDGEVSWHVTVIVGGGISGDCTIQVSRTGGASPISILSRGSGVWSITPIKAGRMLGNNLTPNTLTGAGSYGDWFQTSDAGATAEEGYPVQVSGVLSVGVGPYGSIQEYTTYVGPRKFTRAIKNGLGEWSPWAEVVQTGVGQDCTFGMLTSRKSRAVVESAYWSTPFDNPESIAFNSPLVDGSPGEYFPVLTQKCAIRDLGYPTSSTLGQQIVENNFADSVLMLRGDGGGETVFRFNIYGGFSVSSPQGTRVFTDEANLYNNYSTASSLGGYQETPCWSGGGYGNEHPWVLTALINNNHDDHVDSVGRRPLYFYVGALGWTVFHSI